MTKFWVQSETWLNPNISDNEISIPGYTFSRNDRAGRTGGGTLAFVRDGIPYKTRTDLQSSGIESDVIEITRSKCRKLLIFTIYRAPDQSLDSFIENLNTTLSSIPSENEMLLLGDFNVNFLASKTDPSRSMKQKLTRFANLHNLEQLIDKPTRITENSTTAIDLIFANNYHRIMSSGVLNVHLSDHSLVYCVIKAGVMKAPGRIIEYRSYKNYSRESFLHDLKEARWDVIDDEPEFNTAVEIWNDIFTDIADRHVPIKKFRVKGIQMPWITSQLNSAMQERDYHHRKATKTNSSFHWEMYKKTRKYVNKTVRTCKANYYINLINKNKGNSGEIWKTLNNICTRKSRSPPSCIEADGVSYTEATSIAEVLNNHFSTIGTKLATKIKEKLGLLTRNLSTFPSTDTISHNKFSFNEVDESFVYKQIQQLKTNKAIGLDRISARLLKDSASVITPVLTKIFNRSLNSSTFPSYWKSGKVIALFKSGDRCNANNYKPITILPTVSKILEKAVHLQVYSYLTTNEILSPQQFGFRPKLSTEIALACFTEELLGNLDKSLATGVVFLDLSKAFDTVDHSILFCKLTSAGFSDESVNWFKSYLSNRSQVTALVNAVSSSRPVPVGVPQGSVLGPLLFLIYVNDLPNCVNNCNISLYADDTVVYYSSDNAHDLEEKLNSDLNRLCGWFNANLLTLNVDKCKFVIYGSTRKLSNFKHVSLKAHNSPLDRTDSFKYLGVTIHQNMCWSDHINSISKKVNQRLGLIRRVKHLLPLHARLTLYNSLVLPLFDYSDIVWGDKNNSTLMDHLQVLQHNAARLILDLPNHSSATEALTTLTWKPLFLRRRYHRCLFIFKCTNQLQDFDLELRKNSNIHHHNTRQRNDFQLPRPRTNWGKQQIQYQSVLDWNSLSPDLRQSTHLQFFKTNLKKLLQ